MKRKVSVWTIILILLSCYFIYQAVSFHNLRGDKWNQCEAISNDQNKPMLNLTDNLKFLEWHGQADDYSNCLDDYTFAWVWYDLYSLVALTFIVLTSLSWRIDYLKK